MITQYVSKMNPFARSLKFLFGQGCGNCKSFQSCHQCKPQLQSILKEQ